MAPLEEGETASSTWDQGRALSTENESGTRGILDSIGQDSWEDVRQSWHDGGGPDSFASLLKDAFLQASTSTSGRTVLKLWICGWSGDARDPATAYQLTGSVDPTHTCFEAEVPSTAVVNMFGVSGSTSVSIGGAGHSDPSQPTLRVEALSPGNLSKNLVSLTSTSLTIHKEIQIKGATQWIYIRTQKRHLERGTCLGAVHPVTSENIPGRTLVVVSAPELQKNQPMYVLIDAGSVLDSSGNSFVVLRTLTPISPWVP